jgi:hypothetical protein
MSLDRFKPLLDRDFLKGELHYEFVDYQNSGKDEALKQRLTDWAARELKRETQAEGSFIGRFFVETWGYREDGKGAETFNLLPKFPIPGSGQMGNRGEADLGIGLFGGSRPEIAQVVCEFKDMKSGLDKPQNRKGNNRSPVMQARDYLWNARRSLRGNEVVQPRFAIVTDMDEFRLYRWDGFPDRYLRFRINPDSQADFLRDAMGGVSLLGEDEASRFERFLFWRLFRPDMLLSDAGRTQLERLIARQGKVEKKLEGDFYNDYRAYRETLIYAILPHRPAHLTKGGAVRLAQKLLDRLIFVMFAEDMGQRVGFPPNELQAQLEAFSRDKLLEPEGSEVWARLKLIFRRMNTGGSLGDATIHQFNGGLFADDKDLDALELPNRLFVRFGQAQNEAKTAEHKDTLYYLAATYNYAREGDARNSIGLYTLGHIFEQSIVELEKLEADAEGRESLTDITKRKRDGVYYTPEWVVQRIVDEVIDPLFVRWKEEAGWSETGDPSAEAALAYWERLTAIKVIDPACGSGAFLIVALRHLEKEFAAAADAAVRTGALRQRPDEAAITDMILENNLFGVDINPSSVEITDLSLWLHTARANRPLSGLDKHIRCGNSLVDKRFYNKRTLDDPEERDRINTFEWEGDFAPGTFDAVIGNPPYVKLQNFKKVHADMADWLVNGSSGEAPYESTGTGNFDLYLPFIEKGLSLLNDGGRMGYIAPNLWPTLEYGEGLRGLVHAGESLEKWLDFRSYQVFEEATVYTAIQIFSKSASGEVRLAFAPDGDISRADWIDDANSIPYKELPARKPWLIAPEPVRNMIDRLGRTGSRLDQPENTSAIFQGLITSADQIYHLKKRGRNSYSFTPVRETKDKNGKTKKVKLAPVAVAIEDEIMKPLVSGVEAKRFIEPVTDTYLLFPYSVENGKARLFTPGEMQSWFPKAWEYLKSFEEELRKRESKKFDDDQWYRFGRHQNIDKQEVTKLLVPRLVANLACFADERGRYYCDNVDVGGVVPARREDVWWLAGLLNAPTTDTIFSWLSKPFRGDYKSANKQFIAPLPIPKADRAGKAALSALAKGMQERRTRRVELRSDLDERLGATASTTWPLDRFLADVRSIPEIEGAAPASLPASRRKAWTDEQRKADEESALARIDGLIDLGSQADVIAERGKLAFRIDEQEVARTFLDQDELPLVEAQWRAVAVDFTPTGKGDASRLVGKLRKLVTTAEPALRDQIIQIGNDIAKLSEVIRDDEHDLHEMTCHLFGLNDEERRLVERGRS